MITYRIKNWRTIFENDRSRERDKCSWCAVPNKQDGLGYSRLIGMPNGPAMYGCFIAMAMIVSKQGKHRDGYLTAKGHPTDSPLTADDIALVARMPVELVQKTLDAVSSEAVDWMEKSGNTEQNSESGADSRSTPVQLPFNSRPTHPSGKGREGKERKGGNSSSPDGDGCAFEVFWTAYPRKVGKGAARKRFDTAIKKTTLEVMLSAIEAQKKSDQWTKDGGQFIPHPSTWLNQERWSDGGTEVAAPEASQPGEENMFRALNNSYSASGPGPKRYEFSTDDQFESALEGFERWKAKLK